MANLGGSRTGRFPFLWRKVLIVSRTLSEGIGTFPHFFGQVPKRTKRTQIGKDEPKSGNPPFEPPLYRSLDNRRFQSRRKRNCVMRCTQRAEESRDSAREGRERLGEDSREGRERGGNQGEEGGRGVGRRTGKTITTIMVAEETGEKAEDANNVRRATSEVQHLDLSRGTRLALSCLAQARGCVG